jgi:hypothetical protein
MDRGGTEQLNEYTLFYGKRNKNHELRTCFFVHKTIISAAKRLECYSYIILRGRWYDIIFLDFHVSREDKPINGNESLHEISNYNGVRVVNFATSNSTMFPHRNINKFTWTFPDGKTHNQIDHILVDR